MGELSKNHCSDFPDLSKGKATVILNMFVSTLSRF